MQGNIYDTVLRNVDGYYKKYLMQSINIKFGGNLYERDIQNAQKKGVIFTPNEFAEYIKSLKEITEGESKYLPEVVGNLQGELEKRQVSTKTPGKSQKLMNERKLISNKMGVISFLQNAEQQNLNNLARSR